jgi:hypothetical protein
MDVFSLGAASAQDEMVGDRVEATFAERLATAQAPATEDGTAPWTEAGYGNPCIIGTGWMEPAASPEERAEPPFIEGQKE